MAMKLLGEGGVNQPRAFPSPIIHYKLMHDLRPDVMVIRDPGYRWFSLLAAFFGRMLSIPIVIYSQTVMCKRYSPLRRFTTRLMLAFFRAAWMTPILGDPRVASRPPDHMFFVPFTAPILEGEMKIIEDPIQILTIGKFEIRKNHILLLQALKRLNDEGVKTNLTILGEASNPQHLEQLQLVKRYIEANSMTNIVKVHVNIPHVGVSSYYKNADFFVLPATAEPASISILEAMGQGLPVICSSTCGTRWYVEDGVSGIFFEDGSLDSLAGAIKCLSDKEKLQKMRRAALERAKEDIAPSEFYRLFKKMLLTRFPKLESVVGQ
jgi:glycosyltransferase involved in cell wall biosynthesis